MIRQVEAVAGYCRERGDAYSDPYLAGLLEQGRLDDEFVSNRDCLKGLRDFHRIVDFDPAPLAEILEQRNREILAFLKDYFEHHPFVGDRKAMEAPDVMVVLACDINAIQDKRVTKAAEIHQETGVKRVIFSGGGTHKRQTEAQEMETLFRSLVPDPPELIREPFSLDTLGNALFTRFLLKQKELFSPGAKMLVVTSEFHALRALKIFSRIFADCRVAVATADTLPDRDAQANLEWAAHELESERVNDDFSQLPFAGGAGIDWSDDVSLLAQLFYKHPFYRNRFDLVREFGGFLKHSS